VRAGTAEQGERVRWVRNVGLQRRCDVGLKDDLQESSQAEVEAWKLKGLVHIRLNRWVNNVLGRAQKVLDAAQTELVNTRKQQEERPH
jgi:hypothetical protein